MTEEVKRGQNVLRAMDIDSISDKEEVKSYTTSSASSGYVSFPRPQMREAGVETATGKHAATSNVNRAYMSSFDPYIPPTITDSPLDGTLENDELLLFDTTTYTTSEAAAVAVSSKLSSRMPPPNSLFDDDDSMAAMSVELPVYKKEQLDVDFAATQPRATSSHVPGVARYLEMEEEPPRDIYPNNSITSEPIRTDSGLLLTHRKQTVVTNHRSIHQQQPQQQQQQQSQRSHYHHSKTAFRNTQQDYFEGENGFFTASPSKEYYFHNRAGSTGSGGYGSAGNHSMVMLHARRLMSFVKIWMVIFAIVLLTMTGALFHSFGHKETSTTTYTERKSATSSSMDMFLPDTVLDGTEEILLLPLNDISQLMGNHNYHHRRQQQQQQPSIELQPLHKPASILGPRRILRDIRHKFEEWVIEHNKSYHSEEEKEKRFYIWVDNHQRTIEKNERHGPCKLTNQHVFGSNYFTDLSPEEFKAKYLTGYKGVYTDELERRKLELPEEILQLRKDSGIVLDPSIHKVEFHESVKQRILMHSPQAVNANFMGGSKPNCKWYDISCFLRWIWTATGIQFGSLVGTMEPKYDKDAYPNGVDWRNVGAITSVRTQGECGACWAVTAVETVEAAYFLATGKLYELSESEIIACDDSCQMCDGGWPQNAYEWVMTYGGLPLLENFPYDADTLKALTEGMAGQSNYYDEESVKSYRHEVCPANENGSKSHDNKDNSYWKDGQENKNYADYSSQGRYGNIKGYGYATERCICYTDGSGCDCGDQDEDKAVRNIASYGPAVVCLEASLWQDYRGGIMTSDIGCGQEFLDMNHCVQVVGYAFTTDEDCNDENCENQRSGSGSRSKSRDDSQRNGYWIVRNQWGENWGMNGYAYVAMGANTCGILNDMTIAYA